MAFLGRSYNEASNDSFNLLRINRQRKNFAFTRIIGDIFTTLGKILSSLLTTYAMYLFIKYRNGDAPLIVI